MPLCQFSLQLEPLDILLFKGFMTALVWISLHKYFLLLLFLGATQQVTQSSFCYFSSLQIRKYLEKHCVISGHKNSNSSHLLVQGSHHHSILVFHHLKRLLMDWTWIIHQWKHQTDFLFLQLWFWNHIILLKGQTKCRFLCCSSVRWHMIRGI